MIANSLYIRDEQFSKKYRVDKRLFILVVCGYALILGGVVFRPIMFAAVIFCFGAVLTAQSNTEIACFLYAWMMFAYIFKFSSSSSSMFTFLEIFALLVSLIKDRFVHKRFLFAYGLYVGFIVLFGMSPNYSSILKAVIVPVLIYVLGRIEDKSILGVRKISTYYALGVLAGSIVGLCKAIIPNLSSFVSYKTVNVGYSSLGFISEDRFSGLLGDPNYYTLHLVLVLCLCAFFYTKHEMKSRVFYCSYAVVALLGGLTGSKSFLFMLAGVTLFLIVAFAMDRQYGRFFLFSIIIVIALYLVFAGYIDVFSRVLSRLQGLSAGTDVTTGRIKIWKDYFTLLNTDAKILFFGNGVGNGYPDRAPHNSYLDIVIICGLLGSLIYLNTLASSLINLRRLSNSKISFINTVPLIALLLLYTFLSMFFSFELPFQIAIVFMVLQVAE